VSDLKGHRPSGILGTAKITSKGRISLPKTVRAALCVSKGDCVTFIVDDGKIVVEASTSHKAAEDPAVVAFLNTLEGSIGAASGFPVELMQTIKAATSGIKVDLDEPIEGEVVI